MRRKLFTLAAGASAVVCGGISEMLAGVRVRAPDAEE
jgi:hypothetical protein